MCTGMIVAFMTMGELRVAGPVGLRIWLKLNRPLRGPRLRPGAVVEFNRGWHQTAGSSEEGG